MPLDSEHITAEAAQAAHAATVRQVAQLEAQRGRIQATLQTARGRQTANQERLSVAEDAEGEALRAYRAALRREAATEVADGE